MKTLAFIPARGGSKRLPGKNLRLVDGRSLLGRTMDSAAWCDRIVVSTEAYDIRDVASCWTPPPQLERQLEPKVVIHDRPDSLSGDHSQIEDAVGHYVGSTARSVPGGGWRTCLEDFDALVILQPTSPLRTVAHIREALVLLEKHPEADSVLSTGMALENFFSVELRPYRGSYTTFEAMPHPKRGGWHDRPRTQDLPSSTSQDWHPTENGAIYATRTAAWARSLCRLSGVVLAFQMSVRDSVDVDTEEDLHEAVRRLREPA